MGNHQQRRRSTTAAQPEPGRHVRAKALRLAGATFSTFASNPRAACWVLTHPTVDPKLQDSSAYSARLGGLATWVCQKSGVSGGSHVEGHASSALGMRSAKATANGLSAGFQRMVHRV